MNLGRGGGGGVVAMVLKYTSLFQPSEPSDGGIGCNYTSPHPLQPLEPSAVVVAMILIYTSLFNHQNHLMVVEVVARVLKYTSLLQPSEPSDGW